MSVDKLSHPEIMLNDLRLCASFGGGEEKFKEVNKQNLHGFLLLLLSVPFVNCSN